uniref:Uncharacterized protein n=1 Tax=Panagrolaimus sp. JU765 TaxID=591449 RepID=A0AC34QBX9_9BILA
MADQSLHNDALNEFNRQLLNENVGNPLANQDKDDNNNYWGHESLEPVEDAIQFHSQISIEDHSELSDINSSYDLSDVSAYQWYMNRTSDLSSFAKNEAEEKENLSQVLKGCFAFGGLRWDQIMMFYQLNDTLMPVAGEQKEVEEYIEKLEVAGMVMDKRGNKRYFLASEATPEEVLTNQEKDDTQSVYSSCNSSWGAQTEADYEALLEDL